MGNSESENDIKLIHEGERLDELNRNNLMIIQDPSRFCFGMDAVLLSGFAKVKEGENAIDLGTGLFRSFSQQKQKGNTLPDLRYSRRMLISQTEVFVIIIWKTK